jgi:hypothetical protein
MILRCVRLKKMQVGDSSMLAQVLFEKRNLWKGSPARVLEPTWGRYRGSRWKSIRKVTGWENFLVGY